MRVDLLKKANSISDKRVLADKVSLYLKCSREVKLVDIFNTSITTLILIEEALSSVTIPLIWFLQKS